MLFIRSKRAWETGLGDLFEMGSLTHLTFLRIWDVLSQKGEQAVVQALQNCHVSACFRGEVNFSILYFSRKAAVVWIACLLQRAIRIPAWNSVKGQLLVCHREWHVVLLNCSASLCRSHLQYYGRTEYVAEKASKNNRYSAWARTDFSMALTIISLCNFNALSAHATSLKANDLTAPTTVVLQDVR